MSTATTLTLRPLVPLNNNRVNGMTAVKKSNISMVPIPVGRNFVMVAIRTFASFIIGTSRTVPGLHRNASRFTTNNPTTTCKRSRILFKLLPNTRALAKKLMIWLAKAGTVVTTSAKLRAMLSEQWLMKPNKKLATMMPVYRWPSNNLWALKCKPKVLLVNLRGTLKLKVLQTNLQVTPQEPSMLTLCLRRVLPNKTLATPIKSS